MGKYTAIYLRVSTEEQAKSGYSIPAQKEKLVHYCKQHQWIYQIFDDAGYSAGSLKRPAIQKLIQKIKKNKVERVVVWKLDRLSRRMSNLYWLISLFEKYGVELVSISENISTDLPMGKLLTGILGSVAEFERESIKERIKAVKDTRKKVKGLPLGHPPFGYNNNWKVIPEQAEVIRKMFEMARYAGFTKIAKVLNQKGIKTRDGNLWTKVAVSRILNNCTYAGLIKLEDGSYIKGKISPIISEESFFAIQEKIKARRRKQDISASPHLLTGILKCGLCGKGMVICGDYKAGKSFYVCNTKVHRGAYACKNRRFKADFVEGRVGEIIFSKVVSANKVKIVEKIRQKLRSKKSAELKNEEKDLKQAIRSVKRRLGRLYELFEEEVIERDVLLERVGELKKQRMELEARLEKVKRQLESANVDKIIAVVEEALRKFEVLWRVADHLSKKELLKALVTDMIAYPEKIVVNFVWGESVEIDYPRNKALIEVSEFERKQLEKIDKIHAKIVLMAADGMKAKDIAAALGVDFSKVIWVIGNYRKKGMAYIRNARVLKTNQSIPEGIKVLLYDKFEIVRNLSISELRRFLKNHGFNVSNQLLKNIAYNFLPYFVQSKYGYAVLSKSNFARLRDLPTAD